MTNQTFRAAAVAALLVASHGLLPASADAQGTSAQRPLPAEAPAAEQASPEAAAPSARPARVRRDRNALSAEEIQASMQTDALGIVRTLRPAWLRSRGTGSLRGPGATVRVYVDGRMAGGVEALRQVPASSIREMRYMDASQATQRYGTDHGAGVIQVTSM